MPTAFAKPWNLFSARVTWNRQIGRSWSLESSTDHTDKICREFQQRFPHHFRFLTEKTIGKSHALNTAIAAAKGDILAFTDDDVLCPPDYIHSGSARFLVHMR